MESQAAPPRMHIVHLSGPRQGETQHFNGNRIVLGRSPDADVLFPPDLRIVSRYHAEIIFQHGGYLLVNQSRNGCFVNDEALDEAWLHPGDIITLAPGGPRISFMPETVEDGATRVSAHPETVSFTLQYQGRIRSFRKSGIVIGSGGDCDLQVDQAGIQEHHLHLFYLQDSYRVRPLHDNAGIEVNRHALNGETILFPGDELRLHPGASSFLFLGDGKLVELSSGTMATTAFVSPAADPKAGETAPAPASALKKVFHFILRR